MKIILCDINEHVINACKDLEINTNDTIKIVHGDIFQQEYNAIATPSNSFGFMDGNFDLEIIKKYGDGVEKLIKNYIVVSGEILVGDCCEHYHQATGHAIFVAPTMRLPMPIVGTVNAYLAMKKIFSEAKSDGYKTLALPAFGTGCGQLSANTFARQFKAAVEHYKNPPVYESWHEARIAHYNLTRE
jgi:O-acetyl-ADP-ribose deacetylase (regulator of RNase III)